MTRLHQDHHPNWLLWVCAGLILLVGLGTRLGAGGQDTLSSQVLRLLARANSWTGVQIFTVDVQVSTVNTAAPASAACDAAGEVGKIYWDSSADLLYVCSGASGWRKISTASP